MGSSARISGGSKREGAGYRDPLLLTPRHVARSVMHAIGEIHHLEQLRGAVLGRRRGTPSARRGTATFSSAVRLGTRLKP